MKIYRTGAELLRELFVTEPREIDVDVLAHHCSVSVQYAPLKGCAAHIIGRGDRAVITVDENSSIPRQRFSVGHELRAGEALEPQVCTA